MPAKIQAAIAATKHPMVVILTLLTLVSCGGGGGAVAANPQETMVITRAQTQPTR